MIFSWFRRPEDAEFAKKTAANIERRLPPSVAKSRKDKLNVQYLGDIFESILGEATHYKKRTNPNLFRKARIANIFRWELKNYGYPDEFITDITKALVIYMSKK